MINLINIRSKKILAGIVGISIIFSFMLIAPLQSSSAAEPVVLTVMGDGVEKEVAFTMADLQALPQKTYTYSGYNHWPSLKVFEDMTGPTLKSILEQAGLKDNATLLKCKPSGGKYVHIDFTKEQLLDEPRFYFPAGENPGDVAEWPPQRSEKGKVPVETIIALNDSQGRICFGQVAPNEPTGGDCVMIQELCNNGVIEVSTEVPRQWQPPAADPPSGKIALGTKVSLVKPDKLPDNVMMYYTLDGSEPTYGSYIFNISYPSFQPAFNSPIPVSKDLIIKARTIGFGRLDSEVVSFQYDAERQFADTANHWAKNAINSLVEKGIITGINDTEFKPEEKITRAQFARLLITALDIGVNPGASISFKDVPASAWYYDSVMAAVNAGLITGYGDGIFAPDENISREQMAVIISRALHMKSATTLADGNSEQVINKFTDKGDISPWAEQGVNLAVSCGILNGVSESTFAPQVPASRAEAAVMILQLYSQLH